MGRATEQLASRSGSGIGGILNATFGNAAELIIGLVALSKGLTGVVKASIAGSISATSCSCSVHRFSLVGCAIRNRLLIKPGRVSRRLLSGSAGIALLIPTVFHVAAAEHPGGWTATIEAQLSVAIALVLFLTYFRRSFFTLSRIGSSLRDPRWAGRASEGALAALAIDHRAGYRDNARGLAERGPRWINRGGTTHFGFDRNLCWGGRNRLRRERGRALHGCLGAWKNKMDLSLGIATGSSLQIALFVMPTLVSASYAFGTPMNLEFSLPEITSIMFSIWIVGKISGDGESNWFEGVQLLAVYVIIALLFFFLPAPASP